MSNFVNFVHEVSLKNGLETTDLSPPVVVFMMTKFGLLGVGV